MLIFFPTDYFKVCILIPYSISSLNVRPPRFYDRPHLPLGIIYHYKLSVPTHSEYSLDPSTSTPCNAYIVQFHRNLFAYDFLYCPVLSEHLNSKWIP